MIYLAGTIFRSVITCCVVKRTISKLNVPRSKINIWLDPFHWLQIMVLDWYYITGHNHIWHLILLYYKHNVRCRPLNGETDDIKPYCASKHLYLSVKHWLTLHYNYRSIKDLFKFNLLTVKSIIEVQQISYKTWYWAELIQRATSRREAVNGGRSTHSHDTWLLSCERGSNRSQDQLQSSQSIRVQC